MDSGVCDIVDKVWSFAVGGTSYERTKSNGQWLVVSGQCGSCILTAVWTLSPDSD